MKKGDTHPLCMLRQAVIGNVNFSVLSFFALILRGILLLAVVGLLIVTRGGSRLWRRYRHTNPHRTRPRVKGRRGLFY